ncbi:hypothetical protein SO802_024742 [Lithocarpus litseifolius]|uniref:Uncharacterized protein n=1 Tax=Lithocarpus litseifolius TaxID=425828 RepID=A0AAW2CD27_9ROSI
MKGEVMLALACPCLYAAKEVFSQPTDISNAPNHEVNDNVPNLFPYHTNLQKFEIQIQEIDTELGKFDHQHSELNHKTANIPHVPVFLEKELEISLNAREATFQDLTPHVTDSNDPPSSECMTLRKWKKLARDSPMQNDPLSLITGKELEVLIQAKDPSVVFLAETWADEARLKDIKRNINFENLFFVESNTSGGGLALYWKHSLDLLLSLLLRII